MVVSPQLVDVSLDPLDQRRRRRQVLLRIGIPIVGVGLMVATILGIALYADRANRSGALALSNDLLATLEQRIALAASAYLDPPVRAVRVMRSTVPDGTVPARLPMIEAFAASLLREIPQMDDIGFADSDGNYVMARRAVAGGTDIKLVDNVPGPHRVMWIHLNAAREEVGREEDPDDKFDPRTRPWYTGALETTDVFWTGVYIFFTSQSPGLTVSASDRDPGGRTYLVQVDIALQALSGFLSSLEIGRSGRAVIMDKTGRLIAAPTSVDMLRKSEGATTAARVDEVGDPALDRAYDRFRTDGFGHHVIEVDGRRYIAAVTPLASMGRDWALLMVVPEDDFVGFVASNNRTALAMSLVIVALAALLASLLVRQGLRADRSARLVLDRQNAISQQSAAFAKLAGEASQFDPSHAEPPRAVTETLTEIGRARRASVWQLRGGGQLLRCEDSFEGDTGSHADGFELHHDELPQFFTHLLAGEEIDVADAARDRRTAELHRVVMNPLGTRALLAVPVRRDGKVVGAVWLEDAESSAGTRDFTRAVSNMIALRMAEAPATARADRTSARPTADGAGMRSFEANLRLREIDPAVMEAEVHGGVSVMVLHFTDSSAMALRQAAGGRSLSDEIVCAMQKIAVSHDIPYLKFVGHEMVAAVGFEASAARSAELIADAAVAMRQRCLTLFEESDRPPEFRIGIDHGIAIGSVVGGDPRIFNLWGESVRTADSMARSALPGTIQATEAAYVQLRQDFLFRARGRFFLPRVGETRTFVLSGRL